MTLGASQLAVPAVGRLRRHVGAAEMVDHRLLAQVGTVAFWAGFEEEEVAAAAVGTLVYPVDKPAVADVAESLHLGVEKLALLCCHALLSGVPHGVVVKSHITDAHTSYRLGAECEPSAGDGIAHKPEHLLGVGHHRLCTEQEVKPAHRAVNLVDGLREVAVGG